MLINNFAKYIVVVLALFALASPAKTAEQLDIDQAEIDAAVKQVADTNPFELMRQFSQPQTAAVSPQVATPQVIEEVPELFVEAVMLKFLKAKNVASAVEKLVSPYGTVATDEDTNTLIICGSREQVDRALSQVRRADQTPKQIMIDVVILDVVLDDDTEMGVDWNLTSIMGGVDENQTYQHTLTSLASGATFNFFRSGIDITVKALQEHKDVEILSTPRIMVLSGQTATIKTVEEIPYQESSQTSEGGNLTSVEFKEAGITLEVSPIITDEGKIILNVKPSQSVKTGEFGQVGTQAASVPIVDKREVDTTLILEDGQTVVIGGLRKKHETMTLNAIPILGDFPVVGNLFRNDKTEIVNSELLVMLCPKVHKGTEILNDYEQEKYDELKNRQPLRFETQPPKMKRDLEALGKAVSSLITD